MAVVAHEFSDGQIREAVEKVDTGDLREMLELNEIDVGARPRDALLYVSAEQITALANARGRRSVRRDCVTGVSAPALSARPSTGASRRMVRDSYISYD